METTNSNTASLSSQSVEIDQMFTQLENAPGFVQSSGNEFLHCHECSNPECCSSCPSNLDLAATPVNHDVPTSRGSSRPIADKLHYRHQPVINSVFKIPYSPDAEFKTLCQDCLRVVCHPTKQVMEMAHNEFFFCDCGGLLCCFEECFDLAYFVARNGSSAIPELARVGVIKPITGPFIYSPATGIVREQSK